MTFGLPIAVAVGWTLAGPPKRPSLASPPTGAGGIGAAPGRTHEPVTDVRYQPRPNRSPSPSAPASGSPLPSLPPSTSAPVVTPPAEPSASDSAEPLPPLNEPPVPTPTEEDTSQPSMPDPVATEPTESGSPSAQP